MGLLFRNALGLGFNIVQQIQLNANMKHNKSFKFVPALRASTGRKNAAHFYAA